MSEYKVKAEFCAEDIMAERPAWSKEKAEEFLLNHSNRIEEMMVQGGWDAINVFLEDEDE